MENQTHPQEKSAQDRARYGRPSVPPNLFTDKKSKPMSKQKMFALTGIFAAISFVILFYPYHIMVKAVGKTVPAIIYSVDAPVAGRVIKMAQAEGSVVQAGETIAVLQNDSLQNEIVQQMKEEEILKSRIEQATVDFQARKNRVERYRLYLEVGTVSSMELKEADSDLAKTGAEINLLKRQLEKAQAVLDHLRALKDMEIIKAPAGGVILTRLKDRLGMVLAVGDEIFKLASHDMVIEFLVPEDHVQHITVGAEVKIRFISEPFKTHKASIIKLDEKVDEQIDRMWLVKNVIRITVRLDESFPLTPGMKTQAIIRSRGKTTFARKIAACFFL